MLPSADQKRGLEEHYMEHRRVILFALAVAPMVSAASNLLLNDGSYDLWGGAWIAARILLPLLLTAFDNLRVQRLGLAAVMGLLVVGLFR